MSCYLLDCNTHLYQMMRHQAQSQLKHFFLIHQHPQKLTTSDTKYQVKMVFIQLLVMAL